MPFQKQIGRPFWGRPMRGILFLLEIYVRVRSPRALAQKSKKYAYAYDRVRCERESVEVDVELMESV